MVHIIYNKYLFYFMLVNIKTLSQFIYTNIIHQMNFICVSYLYDF